MGIELIVGLAIVGVVLLWVVRQFGERKLRVRTMWLIPALMAYLSFQTVWTDLFGSFLGFSLILGGLGLGVAAGWGRGRLARVRVERDRRALFVQRTAWGTLLWAAVVLFKLLARDQLGNTPGLAASALLAFSLATVLAHRAYLYWRYFRDRGAVSEASPHETKS